MKEFLFNVSDGMSNKITTYKVKATDKKEAKEKFKCSCLPLFSSHFTWEEMFNIFYDQDITISIIEVDNIIEL